MHTPIYTYKILVHTYEHIYKNIHMETMTQTHTCTHIDDEGVSSAHATHLPSCVPSVWFVSSRSSLGAYSAHRLVLLFLVMSVSINYVLFVRKKKWGKPNY